MWQKFDLLKFWPRKTEVADEDDNENESLEKALAELDTESDSENQIKDEELEVQGSGEVGIQRKVGEITNVKEALLVIDGEFCITRGESNYNLKVGQKVEYTLVDDGINGRKATSVQPWEKDLWSMDDVDENNHEIVSNISTETRGTTRIAVCQVLKKDRGILYLISDNMDKCEVNMDDVSIDFIPVKGDWLNCTVVVELNKDSPNLTGDIVLVKKIGALRHKIATGEVTLWKNEVSIGIIDREVSFTSDACSTGYVPHVGDKVIFECIESHQGGLTWRAVSVAPESTAENDGNYQPASTRSNFNQKNSLYSPKEGISVTLLSRNLSFKLGSVRDLEVLVRNSASEGHKLTNYKMRTIGNKSQISIKNGPKLPYVLEPDSEFTFALTVTASFIGKSDESLVLSFNDKFHIGCAIDLTVDDDTVLNLKAAASLPQKRFTRFESRSIVPTRNALICPGVKPIKPPPFIPVHSPQFYVPDIYYEIVMDKHGRPRKVCEIEEQLEKHFPVLMEPLEKKNYGDRFHALLHLEEVNIVLKMRQYYQERAVFYVSGEFFCLEVPRLCETRPSLIVGDKVNAFNPDVAKHKFEGFVHKTFQNEVFLKFNTAFDEVARGNTFEVTFHHGRGVFKKSHQAIEIFCRKDHLGVDWLFPSSLRSAKHPQVIIKKEEYSDTPSNGHPNETEDRCSENQGAKISSPESVTKSSNSETVIKSGSSKASSSRLNKLLSLLNEDEVSEINLSASLSSSSSVEAKSENHDKMETTSAQMEEGSSVELNGGESVKSSSCSFEDVSNDESKAKSVTSNLKPSSLDAAYQHYNHSTKLRKDEKINWVSSGRGYDDIRRKPNIVKSCQVASYDKIRWFNPSLNSRQKEGVKNVLKGEVRPLPYIIHGPPGTGKTVTMVETILQILSLIPDSRLLIATPSNSAADLITERILTCFGLLPGELVRLVSFSYWNDGRVPSHLRPYSAIADLKECPDKTETSAVNGVKICSRDSLGRHRVTVGTCTSIGVLYTLGFPAGHFSHVFVDEAGQATEPEILIPLAFLHETNGQAILAGDPMQLGPVVTSQLALRFGLGQSLLFRLISRYPYIRDFDRFPTTGGHDPRLVTKLLDNYRSIPELLRYTSNQFYDSELIPQIAENSSEEQILRKMANDLPPSINNPERAASLVFHGVRGENFQEGDSPSWFNPQELVQVIIYLRKTYEAGLKEDHVGIITPYQKQASKIRQMINEMNLAMPKVGSVEEFQGQERHVIIVSVVRSKEELCRFDAEHALGFLRNPFRVNVATSRARALLIIIGNSHLLSLDCYWRSVIKYAAKIGGYTGCSYPEFLDNSSDD